MTAKKYIYTGDMPNNGGNLVHILKRKSLILQMKNIYVDNLMKYILLVIALLLLFLVYHNF